MVYVRSVGLVPLKLSRAQFHSLSADYCSAARGRCDCSKTATTVGMPKPRRYLRGSWLQQGRPDAARSRPKKEQETAKMPGQCLAIQGGVCSTISASAAPSPGAAVGSRPQAAPPAGQSAARCPLRVPVLKCLAFLRSHTETKLLTPQPCWPLQTGQGKPVGPP